MFGTCGNKVDSEIAPGYARVYCTLVDREAKLGGRATLMDAQRKLCHNCQFIDRQLVDGVKPNNLEEVMI